MKPQHLFYALLVLTGLIVIAGGVGYYLSHARLQDKIDQVERFRADIMVASEQLDNLQELEVAYIQLQPLEDKTNRILPEQKMQSEVTAVIFNMINNSGLRGSSINYESTDGIPDERTQTAASGISGVRVMPASFRVQGSYRQLLSFLDSIERQERLMQVTSLDISRSSDDNVLSFGIGLEVFIKL